MNETLTSAQYFRHNRLKLERIDVRVGGSSGAHQLPDGSATRNLTACQTLRTPTVKSNQKYKLPPQSE